MDVKQTKTELGVTKGESIEIIRLINNPKGKWLCRNNYGKGHNFELTLLVIFAK